MSDKDEAINYFSVNAGQYVKQHYETRLHSGLWRRHRAILKTLADLKPAKDSHVLELGCGPGILARDLAEMGYSGVGVDAAPAMIDLCKQRYAAEKWPAPWSFEVADVESLPFPDASADVVIAAGVIEYLPSDEKMLSEIQRVLKPNGILILNVTNKWGYTTCFSTLLRSLKSFPAVQAVANPIRRLFAKDGQPIKPLVFRPRKQRPGVFRASLAKNGLQVTSDQYLEFTLFPAPFSTITSRLTESFEAKLDCLDHTPARYFGACYLVTAKRT